MKKKKKKNKVVQRKFFFPCSTYFCGIKKKSVDDRIRTKKGS